ncbi:hypothetical protein KQI86_19800 [Clostridium sp. MSJ-11]|uniref:Uncharacterized protein n=1 Tax=Clostridium mobile TaxID=2841512 RepID=A0ABS6EQ61_9CLOT|nr:hypothetical protein [Clostridium mobile]MBU5486535.1 hypothetical protein [Clostridium mobile]
MSKNNYIDSKDINTNAGLASFYNDERAVASGNVRFGACELCRTVGLGPSLNNMSRLLRVNVRLMNVCYGKELTVGCIITDTAGRVLAYKSETFIATREDSLKAEGTMRSAESDDLVYESRSSNCGCSGSCGDVTRVFNIILPNSDVCSPLDVNARVMANYTSPCN